MSQHTAKSIFDLNIESADACISLYKGVTYLKAGIEASWLLRSAVVFSISAMDSYFHDKIRYRAAKIKMDNLPNHLVNFKVSFDYLERYRNANRKMNIISNVFTEHFSVKPLMKKEDIKSALKLVGIENLWATIEPDTPKLNKLLSKLKEFVDRRNKIAHEGDRERSRASGKKLRKIDLAYAEECIEFTKSLVERIEQAFPK